MIAFDFCTIERKSCTMIAVFIAANYSLAIFACKQQRYAWFNFRKGKRHFRV